MTHKVFLLLIFLFKLGNSQSILESEEGDACKTDDGENGICTIAKNCEWSKNLIQTRQLTFDKLVRCQFKGHIAVICCQTEAKQVSVGRKAAIACEKIKNIAPALKFHILEGTLAEPGEFPHQTALVLTQRNIDKNYDLNCGGTLISKTWVMTAAHCVVKTKDQAITLILGSYNLLDDNDPKRQSIEVKNIILHPEYTVKGKYNDIALIELKQPVKFTDEVYPACLESTPRNFESSQKFIVSGWGIFDRTKATSPRLLKGELNWVPEKDCNNLYKDSDGTFPKILPTGLRNSQFCALDPKKERKVDTCGGDSGGPLQIASNNVFEIIGITSFGAGCGSDIPGIYTRVSEFLDFIEKYVWPGKEVNL